MSETTAPAFSNTQQGGRGTRDMQGPDSHRLPILQRASTTSSKPPDYGFSDRPPSYSKAMLAKTTQQSQKPPTKKFQDHTGSCGMPASTIQSVLGSPYVEPGAKSGQGKPSSERRKDGFWKNVKRRWLESEESTIGTSGTWNVQGVVLSDFGSLRRSKN